MRSRMHLREDVYPWFYKFVDEFDFSLDSRSLKWLHVGYIRKWGEAKAPFKMSKLGIKWNNQTSGNQWVVSRFEPGLSYGFYLRNNIQALPHHWLFVRDTIGHLWFLRTKDEQCGAFMCPLLFRWTNYCADSHNVYTYMYIFGCPLILVSFKLWNSDIFIV